MYQCHLTALINKVRAEGQSVYLAVFLFRSKQAICVAKLTAIADLMDSKGYYIEDLEKLMSMPKPVEQEVVEETTEEE